MGYTGVFCKSGFCSLLILLTQLRSVIYRWSTDIFLQANKLSSAILFYTAVGFEKYDENSTEASPVKWQDMVNNEMISNFYIKFVDTKTSKEEANQRAKAANEEPNFDEILHCINYLALSRLSLNYNGTKS